MGRFRDHKIIIQHDGENWNITTNRSFEIESGHAESRIAHEVDAELVWRGQFGAHDQPETRAESVRFSPANITSWCRRLIERNELITWAAGVMGDDRFFGIDCAHELPENPIRIDRHFFRAELRHPLTQPGLSEPGDLRSHRTIVTSSFYTSNVFDRCDELSQTALGMT